VAPDQACVTSTPQYQRQHDHDLDGFDGSADDAGLDEALDAGGGGSSDPAGGGAAAGDGGGGGGGADGDSKAGS
jgi:hypothetical protein